MKGMKREDVEMASVQTERQQAKPEEAVLTLEDARANRFETDWDTLQIPVPWFVGRRLVEPAVEDLVPFIGAARELGSDTHALLPRILAEQRFTARGVYGFWPANAKGDDIVVYKDDARQKEIARFRMLRQQEPMADGQPNRSLADFIAPRESMAPDYIGAFAVSVHIGEPTREDQQTHDDDNAAVVAAIANRLAEAFAEFLHAQARKDWGYGADEALSVADLTAGNYRGMRVAFGDPASPDHSEKAALVTLLDAQSVGISLTDSFAMVPVASISGFYFSHSAAKSFDVGRLGRDQVEDYAARKSVTFEQAERWLAANIGY